MENNHQKFQFKTNINCSGCVAAVKPHLDQAEGIAHWEVDTSNKDKVLTVELNGASPEELSGLVEKAGFKIELLNP